MSLRPALTVAASVVVDLYIHGQSYVQYNGETLWGASLEITVIPPSSSLVSPTTHMLELTGVCGAMSNPAAEFIALISGLRAIIRHLATVPISPLLSTVRVLSENEDFVRLMRRRARLNTPNLSTLTAIYTGLRSRFHVLQFYPTQHDQCGYITRMAHRHRNPVRATKLSTPSFAACARPRERVVYYPSLLGLVDATVFGQAVRASHDVGTHGRDPRTLIDAHFLAASLDVGPISLRNLADPYPITVVLGRVSMTVLGTIELPVSVAWPRRGGLYPAVTQWVSAVVVDALPVPLHVSTSDVERPLFTREGPVCSIDLQKMPFSRVSVPRPFADHSFWSCDASSFNGKEVTIELDSRIGGPV